MKIETIQISKLLQDPSNARKHNTKNLEAIKGSLTKFGQQKPLIVDDKNIVVAGNGTLQAAIDLGWGEIKIVRTELKGSMQVAFSVADNRTTDLSEFDDEILSKTLAGLEMDGFDIADIGFDSMPEFSPDIPSDDESNDQKEEKLSIVVMCKNIDEQQELFDELNSRGFKVKI